MDAPRPLPALIYLDAAAVEASMPPLEERLRLAELTMRALVDDAETPPKIGVHPGPPGSFAHAMPAWLDGRTGDVSADLLGLKWVTGFPANRAVGQPGPPRAAILGAGVQARSHLPVRGRCCQG